ncbi:MAG TPA: diacylglycerol kinase family protein [Kofleriaceae bacterium]|nr:diacylglycerol kinase family protein [Kofleriaceae bacterium]
MSSKPPAAVLVANPTAQSGKAETWIARARELLDAAGITHDFIPTAPAGGTVGAVRRAIDQGGVDLAIAMGGDGTFAEVAKGILGSTRAGEVALGMLPMGTANDQGKSFGLRAGLDALAENVAVLARGVTSEMDVGVIQRLDEGDRVTHSDLFFDSASIGLGAEVLAGRNRDRDRVAVIPLVRSFYRDQLIYAGALIKRLARSATGRTTFDLEAEVDGETLYYKSVVDVIVKNTRIYGGEWVLAADGMADDGLFEMVLICGLGELTSRAVSGLRSSPIGEYELAQLGIKPSRPVPGRRFVLTVMQPGATGAPAAQIDGEEFPAGDRFRVECLPRVLRLVVPRLDPPDAPG